VKKRIYIENLDCVHCAATLESELKRIDGVLDAKQYTVPVAEAVERVQRGENPLLTTREKHKRECFVVAKDGADKAKIEREIVTMPNYFADYDTTVHFISLEELIKNHGGLPHGGKVIRCGNTGKDGGNKHVIEYSLKLDSNAEFTSSVLVACARAVYKLEQNGDYGCKTVLDIPPVYFSAERREDLIKKYL
jgi:diaminopimelate dehydrogenase